jgi:uncharacterized RmlC-like cupin family protein
LEACDMATMIQFDDSRTTKEYEPGLHHTFCLTDKTCGARAMCMFKAVIPPRTKTRAHYHPGIEINAYVLSGSAVITAGPAKQRLVVGPSTFLHIPADEVHLFSNESDSEPLVMIAAYSSPVGEDMPKVEVHEW